MSTTQSITADLAELAQGAEMRNVGIEFEYPVADVAEDAPATPGRTSEALYHQHGARNDWDVMCVPRPKAGYVGSDHTGAEITSGVLDLYSSEPLDWYTETAARAEEMGYPPAFTGTGDTNFGLHLHLSEVPERVADLINDMTNEDWTRIFFCSSLTQQSLDPWRHGGIINYDDDAIFSRPENDHGDRHYEWRLPEPMKPEHFELVLEFLRRAEMNSTDDAYEFARELVFSTDDRLTPVEQFNEYQRRRDNWPTPETFRGTHATDEAAAETVYEILS